MSRASAVPRKRLVAVKTVALYFRRGTGGKRGDELIAVELRGKSRDAEPVSSCGLAVVVGRGRRITVSPGFDAATLQRLVQVLEVM